MRRFASAPNFPQITVKPKVNGLIMILEIEIMITHGRRSLDVIASCNVQGIAKTALEILSLLEFAVKLEQAEDLKGHGSVMHRL